MTQKTVGGRQLCPPQCTHQPSSRADAVVMGWRKQSSGSHHGYSQPQSPQHKLICYLQGLFLMEKGLTRVPHQRAHQGGFPKPFSHIPLPCHYKQEVKLHPGAPLCDWLRHEILAVCLVPNTKEMS